MKLSKSLVTLAAAGAMSFAALQAQAAPSFVLDLTALPTATDAYTGNGVTGPIDELQFAIGNNTVTVTFNGANPDFGLGSTFTFTDTGTIEGSAFLPTGLGKDYEGFNSTWTMLGGFSLSGSGSVIGFSVAGDPILSYTFNAGGSLFLDYVDSDETISILDATSQFGEGVVTAKVGASIPTASAFIFTSLVGDLLDGFWLKPDGSTPYLDGMTLALADGNVNQTTTTALGSRTYAIVADSDGSASLRAIPEPGSLALVSAALLMVGAATRRRESKK